MRRNDIKIVFIEVGLAILAYLTALYLNYQLNSIGIHIPAWIFHVFGILIVAGYLVASILLHAVPIHKRQKVVPAANVFSGIALAMTAVALTLVVPADVGLILTKHLLGKEPTTAFFIVFILLTVLLGATLGGLFFYNTIKVFMKKDPMSKLLNIVNTPELCTEESFPEAESYLNKISSMEENKLAICALYERAKRPDIALDFYKTINPERFHSNIPISSYLCDLLYYYLIGANAETATRFFQANYAELSGLYAAASPGQLHTFAMFYRMTGDIPTARKILNEMQAKTIPEPFLFCFSTENAYVCLAEGNIAGASEALEQARSLAKFPNEKAAAAALEEAIKAAKISI